MPDSKVATDDYKIISCHLILLWEKYRIEFVIIRVAIPCYVYHIVLLSALCFKQETSLINREMKINCLSYADNKLFQQS